MRLILGFSAGSASDQIAREFAPAFTRALGTRTEVVLRPGANGALAATEVARSTPDGRTLFMATLGTHALAPHLTPAPAYHAQLDFAPVSLLTRAPLVLACHTGLGVATARELVSLARTRELTYGTSAIGGAPHLAAALFEAVAGVRMRHVRYDHTERLYDDLQAGRIDLSFNNMMSMLPRCTGGTLRALAVTGARRSAVAPSLPTLAECGLPSYEVTNWLGIVAPAGTPPATVETLSAAAATALATRDVNNRLHEAGVEACGSTPAQFAEFVARETVRWKPIVERLRDDSAPLDPPQLKRSSSR